ncbi:alpha-protein kinase 1 [Pseudonaja textilis]|uniref:alpha-protein kinase 1 n=1 Tax=Pseudonaja textilis TaxID=8673 RepID=UPI000EAA39C5|nr:alpha-protein kinase 1 [Pseudonaja textilis]XP_026553981.1 alpha-protein kinase 1 [Pseudonaja textilis]XP_026553983.1 alpha-protein kinase 1 [Pseudonaja textilis]
MNNQKMVNCLLQECKQMLEQPSLMVEGQLKEIKNQLFGASLPEDLRTLIEEAKEMKWPFVPERWQYKQAIDLEDKTNLQDMINARLHELLVCLKTSIASRDYLTATAIAFLVDRFLYWVDGSSQLLQIVKRLHQLEPTVPIAPQLVIRQARISVNSGKLLKAEYILSSLIIDNGATGVWKYCNESDCVLVQSVCIQIRGQILQKLGMWYEAAELIWASILGYFTLPQPDKKGIATSLGILADIFISMSEDDYVRFKNNSQLGLNLLKEFDHRLLSAAEACKLAAVLSQFTPLFVLTAVNIRGMCLLTYSCSSACPPEKRAFYLSQAKESFEIGLLSKKDKEPVTSKQELHSFIKAAFSLAKVHQHLYGESKSLNQVNQLCQDALAKLYAYSYSLQNEEQEKELLAKDIMSLVMSVKEQLQVQSFPNSDAKSYIPDCYKTDVKKVLNCSLSFEEVLRMYFQHHESVCAVFESTCRNHKIRPGKQKARACITTLKTATRNMDTIGATEANSHYDNHNGEIPVSQKENKRQRKKIAHIVSRRASLDEQTESETSDNQNNSSWEEIVNNKNDLSQDKEQKTKNFIELPEDIEKKIENSDFCLLTNKIHKITLQHSQNGTGSLKHPFPKSMPFTNIPKELDPNLRKKEMEAGVDASKQSCRGTSSTNSKQDKVMSSTSEKEIISSGKVSRTKDSSNVPISSIRKGSIENNANHARDSGPISRNHWQMVDLEGETEDGTEDSLMNPDLPNEKTVPASIRNNISKAECDNFVQNWINQSANMMLTGCSSKISEVKTQAEDDWELVSDDRRELIDHGTNEGIIKDPQNYRTEAPSSSLGWGNKQVSNHSNDCATTEEGDEGENKRGIFNSSHSSSSLKSWDKGPSFSSSFSELGSPPLMNSSESSFSFISMAKEQMQQARILSNDDYNKLFSGVEHAWLVERMKNTGFFKPKLLHRTHHALLLKYSKISGLWTAQETTAYIGDNLSVAKKGKQRNAFWIHFLHQEETLGRYVGKEYKEEKEIIYHFNDVERQMTAQYYVTEFNKRLYEQNIPTQIFYIPSVVLLILEGKSIQGCVTVEPYILGEFVKLSNNTNVVKLEYKATEYGLAYGHFCYEFSQGTDVVVDLQGWVTDNGKGLIYLTDPQIHSVSKKGTSGLTNFGKKGIYYFFNNQHTECNEICSRLSLTRPSIEKPK